MSILFYDHLVDKNQIIIFIEKLDEPENYKSRMKHLVDDIIHQGLIKFILDKLHPTHHVTFLTRVKSAPYDPEIIYYLKDHVSPDIEEELTKEADKLISIIMKDLEES